MRVLVTGAFGTIGRATLLALAAKGHVPRAFDLPTAKNRRRARQHPEAEVRFGDVSEAAQVADAVSGVDAIVHLAAILPPFADRDPGLAHRVNVGGTTELLRAASRTGRAPAFVFASSVSVFGDRQAEPPPRRVAEALEGTDTYTHSKIAGEALVQTSGLPWAILRIGVAIDPAARQADLEMMRTLFSLAPSTRLEYVDPRDVGRALVAAAVEPGAHGRVLLIGGGESCQVTYGDLFDSLFDGLGLERPPREAFGTSGYYTDWLDTEESQRLLGYQRGTFEHYRVAMHHQLRGARLLSAPLRPLLRRALLALAPGAR